MKGHFAEVYLIEDNYINKKTEELTSTNDGCRELVRKFIESKNGKETFPLYIK